MYELIRKVNKIISNHNIGVLLVDKKRTIIWANEYILKKYESLGGVIGEEYSVVLRSEEICKKKLETAFERNEIDRTITQYQTNDNLIDYYRTIFVPIQGSNNDVEHVLILIINLSDREKTAYEVVELNKFLSNVVHNSADAIISLNQEGKIIIWNSGAEVIFGYKTDEVTGRNLDFLLPQKLIEDNELEWIKEVVHRENALVNHETERITKSGKIIIAEVTRTLLKNEDNEVIGYSEIIKDITDRKRIEEELKKTIEELSKLNEIAEFVHGTLDENEILNVMLTGVTAGEGFRFNRAFLFLYNEKNGLLEGVSAVGPSNPKDAEKIWPMLSGIKSLRDVLKIYKDNVSKTNTAITEIVKNIKVPVTGEENVFAKCFNSGRHFAVEKEYTSSRDTLDLLDRLNTDHFVVIPLMGRDKPIGVLMVDNAVSGERMHEEEIELLRLLANQTSMAIENAQLYKNLQEKVELLEKTYLDVKKSQRKLMDQERLAAVGGVTAKIAHEIRNPLVSIGGFAKIMKKDIERGNVDYEHVDIIIEEVSRLEKILSEILSYTKPKYISDKKKGNINDTIEKTISMMSAELNLRSITLEKSLTRNLPEFYYDDWEISQVFINLFINAIQAMPDKGKIYVKSFRDNGSVIVEITDTGCGVSKDSIRNIFAPFFTTKSSGMGLGLTICKQILQDHNFTMDIKSELNKGTTFVISFPVSNEHKE